MTGNYETRMKRINPQHSTHGKRADALSAPPFRQTGFTLTEILVALVVLSVGLLGLAALQITGLRNNQSAYYRSIATTLAYDMADRIRANRTAEDLGSYRTVAMADAPGAGTTNCAPGPCTTAAMATYDVSHWKCSLGNWNTNTICTNTLGVQGDLPLGDGSIAWAGGIYTISIRWDDDRSGALDAGDPIFAMSFRP